jgi:23S rRNA pseudouridine1911/1915/1917 synthase
MTQEIRKNGEPLLLIVPENQPKTRIDLFLHTQLPNYSRSFFNRAIENGLISCNNMVVTKAGHIIKAHDQIQIAFPPVQPKSKETIQSANLPIDIIYEHPHFIIINKPAGLLVHAAPSTKNEITLADWVIHNIENIGHVGQIDRPGIVHRLDKLTSGLMIIARTNYAYQHFAALFHNRAIEKIYYAIVKGHPAKEGTINFPIARDPIERTKMKAFDPSVIHPEYVKIRSAVTHYTVERYYQDAALVRVSLETGRTHQIRVHFAAIGHPIIGDVVYGTKSPLINRQALHAQQLEFTFDTKFFTFQTDLPEDMQSVLKKLNPVSN